MSTAKRASSGLQWTEAPLAPVVLLSGPEDLLADRAARLISDLAHETDPSVEVTHLEAAGYERGRLEMLASPSLFGEQKLVVVAGVEQTNDDFLSEATEYVQSPAEDVWLVLRHGGGVRGKRLLDAVKKAQHPVVICDAIKRDSDKADFVQAEFRRARRRVDASAVRALVDALGNDLRELASACAQLVADTAGTVTAEMVDKYYGGRVEANAFRVADAVAAGRRGEALVSLRHALATGADPVPIVAALAMKMRGLAKVAAARSRGLSARELSMAPWQVERARKELRGWSPDGIACAISALAQADAEVKGLSRDPVFAVERAVLRIVDFHGREFRS
ncbi:MAG TPA: DNA polymerase III subunit delta [Actinomycetales bacterium]|nr:DNA polymerase III subunit delta [Actinomycetales bacterium]